ncbi:MAG: LicD family protein [Bacteroidales bacterium]|nr:LicD family protein [Bacteroidales bacterium]
MTLKRLWHKFYIDPRRQRLMRRYGEEALSKLDAVFNESGVPYSLIYGTLLGAVREKGFIPHDCDIDLALWADEDYAPARKRLRAAGFEPKRCICVDEGRFGYEETWRYKGIYIDFFHFFPDGRGCYYGTEFYNQDGCPDWKTSIARYGGLKVLKTLLPVAKETEYLPFGGIRARAIKSALAFVQEYYGPGWRTPDPSFVYPRKGETNYEELPDKLGVVKPLR